MTCGIDSEISKSWHSHSPKPVTVEVREIEAKKTPSHSFDEIKKILKS
jgi:hypothetical protein